MGDTKEVKQSLYDTYCEICRECKFNIVPQYIFTPEFYHRAKMRRKDLKNNIILQGNINSRDLYFSNKNKELKGFNLKNEEITSGKVIGWSNKENYVIVELDKEIGWSASNMLFIKCFIPSKIKEGNWYWAIIREDIFDGKFLIIDK